MLAYMKYENGLQFEKIIFENKNAAKLWLKQNGVHNPNCYELVKVKFVKEDVKALKKMELEEKLQRAKETVEWYREQCNYYKDDETMVDKLNKYLIEYEKIRQEIEEIL